MPFPEIEKRFNQTGVRYTLLIALLLLATWLGARGLNADSYWVDEYWSVYDAGGAYFEPFTPLQVWDRIATQDSWQAPGYFMALNVWGGAVGWTEFATRALSLLGGLLGIAWTYRLGRDLVSPFGGLVAAAVLGTSAYFLYFFHELRPYSFYVLFTAMLVWVYWRLVTRNPQRWTYALLLIAVLGALYTHYFAGLTAVALGLFHLLSYRRFKDRRAVWWTILAMFALGAVLFLPWVRVLFSGIAEAAAQKSVRGAGALSTQDATTGLLYLFSNGSSGLLLIVVALGIQRRFKTVLVWFWFLCVFVILMIINARLGVLLEVRYMMALWPALAILFALGFVRLMKIDRRIAGGILVLWIGGGIWLSLTTFPGYALNNPQWHQPFGKLRADLAPRVEAGDHLIFLLPDWTWAVYHQDTLGYYLHGLPVNGALIEQPAHYGYDQFIQQGQKLLAPAQRVWIAENPQQPTTYRSEFDHILQDRGFLACGTLAQSDDLQLDLYTRPPTTGSIQFGTDPAFTLTPAMKFDTPSGSLLNVTSVWTTDNPLAANQYSAAFHLVNAAGQMVAQQDYGVPTLPQACHSVDLSLVGLPAGTYTLLTTVYAWQSGERLASSSPQEQADHRVVLGTIRIEN